MSVRCTPPQKKTDHVHPTGKGIVCVAVPGNAEEGVELQTKVRLADGVAVVPSAGAVAPHVVLLHPDHVCRATHKKTDRVHPTGQTFPSAFLHTQFT